MSVDTSLEMQIVHARFVVIEWAKEWHRWDVAMENGSGTIDIGMFLADRLRESVERLIELENKNGKN